MDEYLLPNRRREERKSPGEEQERRPDKDRRVKRAVMSHWTVEGRRKKEFRGNRKNEF